MIAEHNPFEAVLGRKLPAVPAKTPVPSPASGDIVGILRQAGFKGEALKTAYAVSKAESGHRATAFNPNASTGDKSYGLFQINMLGNLGPARRAQYGLKSNEELYDPLTNAKIAYRMSGGGKNWQPWSAYKSGAYKANLGSFPGGEVTGDLLYRPSAPSPIRELPIAKERPAFRELEADNPFAAVLGGKSDNPFAAVFAARPGPVPQAQPLGRPSAVPGLTSSGDWSKYVGQPERRQGPSAPHTPEILKFVGQVGATAGTRLTPWGNESHSLMTVNGTPSAHGAGRAADIPASGNELIRLGRAALVAAGMSPAEAAKANGGIYNIGDKQVIFATTQGGNHWNHVHVGLRG